MEITIKNLQSRIPINQKQIRKAALKTFAFVGVKKTGTINICFVDDKIIKELNKRYLKHSGPTDVIAFNLVKDKTAILADIAVSTDTAVRQAKTFKTNNSYETLLYVVHGLLHILGYDDRTIRQRNLMQEKAEAILQYAHP